MEASVDQSRNLADRAEVLDLLEHLRNEQAAPKDRRATLRRLMVERLGYELRQTPLPTNALPNGLADPPILLADSERGFAVIHTRLSKSATRRSIERKVVEAVLPRHPYALFIFSDRRDIAWTFLNVKVARDSDSAENKNAKARRLFRRISVRPGDQLRTAAERIEMLDLERSEPSLFGAAPIELQRVHEAAFDVEAVTDKFFKQYKAVFERVEETVTGLRGRNAPDKRRLFTQRLFNRLMFLAFVQKKGWLTPPRSTSLPTTA